MRQGAVIGTSILLAKSGLSTAGIGVYEVLLYLGTVLTFFWVNGLLQAMTPVYTKLNEEDRKAFIFNNFLVFCGISLLLTLLLLTGPGFIVPLLTGLPELPHFYLYCLFLLFNLPTFPVEYIYLLRKEARAIVAWGLVSFGLQVAAVFLPVWLGYGLRESMLALAVLAAGKWLFTLGLVVKYGALFGPNPDHRDETPGARSFGIAHIAAVWVGAFALAVYFLFL